MPLLPEFLLFHIFPKESRHSVFRPAGGKNRLYRVRSWLSRHSYLYSYEAHISHQLDQGVVHYYSLLTRRINHS